MDKRILISLIAAVIILTAILAESFFHTYTDNPENSDAIVILGGGDQGRVKKAADLYKAGYAEKVIITPVGERYTTEELVSIIRHYGINEKDILIDTKSNSTYTNAQRTIEIMNDNEFESALIVTNDYHIKRAKLIFDRLSDDNQTFNYIAATNLEGQKWYERDDMFSHWIGEFVKNWGYRFGLYKFFGQIVNVHLYYDIIYLLTTLN